MMAAILNSAIFNSAILDSAILHKTLTQTISICLKLIPSHITWWWSLSWILPTWILPSWFQPFYTKIFTYSFWLNLMMAAILNSAILDSPILCKTLTQTNSIWLKLIHSLSTWWRQPSWTLPFWIHPFCAKLWLKLIQSDSNSFILT